MADYLLMTLEDEAAHAAESPKAMAEHIDARAAFVGELRRAGNLRGAARLRPSKEGKRVGRAGERVRVTDGPFVEEAGDGRGRALGGVMWVEAASVDDAAAIALRSPGPASDAIDVRPIMKGSAFGGTEKPGKIFACAVLGNAPNEAAWAQAMDRVDASSRGAFPETLGGVRLQAPTTGRRVATRGERRATFDGPFLESKEVIGGVFLVRMASLDDVVRWAGASAFIAHGSLEIRELWRT